MSDGKAGWMSVNKSTDLQVSEAAAGAGQEAKKEHPFVKWLVIFFVIILALYLYFVLADLSTAPQYVYSQF